MPLSQAMKRVKKLLQDSSKTLFRALGLNVIFSLFVFLRHKTVGKGYTEPTKVAIRSSRTTALLRALIHIFPVGVALWLIALNWNTYFVGYNVYNLAWYQFGAKVHEIAIEASLSAIVFSYIRYELMLGDGIPFGALFSGLQISQASYLWSMEYWGTFSSKNVSWKSKLRLLSVVTASIFLAAVSGPSSAILLVPKLDYWPAGSTNIWMNITSDSLWPIRTNASDVLEQCLVANTSDVYNYICPSHGWEAIQDYIYTTIHSLDPEYQDLVGVIGNPDWVEVTGRGSQRRLKIGEFHAVSEGYYTNSKGGTTQQSVVADVLTETGQLWADAITNVSTIGHGSVLQQQDAVHTIKSGYYQPYTVVSCANDVIRGPLDDSAVYFPVPPELQGNLMPNQTDFNTQALGISSFVYPGMTKGQILDIPGSLEQYRLKWIELPQDPFNGSAIGAVILPPPTANTTQEFIVCNLGAGWGSSIINTSSNGGGTAFTTSTIDPSAIAHWNPGFNGSLPYYDSVFQAEVRAADDVDNFFAPSFPEKPVIITDAWANYLSPFVPSLNTTVMDALMSTYQPTGEFQIELEVIIAGWILAGLLTNGLSSIGANDGNYWFSGKGDVFNVDPEESIDWVKLRVDSTINGYAYNIHGAGPKVAISFLLAYCVIALSHVLYAGISGISSTCWDSIGEVTALAMNSTPTTLLKNTCAGIMELHIFQLPVRVLAIRDTEGDGEHLELVFGNLDEKDLIGTPIKQNRVYGTLPKVLKAEKSE